MARAKPSSWAAKSLVSETESKAIASPKQQRKAGEVIAVMLGGGAAGLVGKQLGKQIVKKIGTRASDKKAAKAAAKKTVNKRTEIEAKKNRKAFSKDRSWKELGLKSQKELDEYWEDLRRNDEYLEDFEEEPMEPEDSMLKKKHGAKVRKKLTDLGYKAKGGYVKKYARGGGVRKAKF